MGHFREQAREAARARFYDSAQERPAYLDHACIVSADAASDVWGPECERLRDALVEIRSAFRSLVFLAPDDQRRQLDRIDAALAAALDEPT